MTKVEARKKSKDEILKLSQEDKEWASGAIIDAISSLEIFKKSHKIFVFLGTETEPDTHELVGLCLGLEKMVAVPRVSGKNMQAILISPYTNFKTNKWNILEPVGGQILEDIDLAIIPLVAYENLKRVGHGGGYYDRFLSKNNCVKLGIAFDCQEMQDILTESFDIPLDILVTEKKIIKEDKIEKNIYGYGANS